MVGAPYFVRYLGNPKRSLIKYVNASAGDCFQCEFMRQSYDDGMASEYGETFREVRRV